LQARPPGVTHLVASASSSLPALRVADAISFLRCFFPLTTAELEALPATAAAGWVVVLRELLVDVGVEVGLTLSSAKKRSEGSSSSGCTLITLRIMHAMVDYNTMEETGQARFTLLHLDPGTFWHIKIPTTVGAHTCGREPAGFQRPRCRQCFHH
jgi:hypothetical protein